MAVTIAAAWIMREDDGTDESEFSPGDVVRVFGPPQSLIDNPQSTQQRCSLMIVTGLSLTDAQFLSMQHSVGVRHDDAQYNPYTPGTPEYRAWEKPLITTFLLREWRVPWTPAEYADLSPPRRRDLDDIVAELQTPPYACVRTWNDIRQLAWRNKRDARFFDENEF
jgi:hypothetical protein